MSFIVENGSALTNSTSYASVAELDGYYSSIGIDLSTESSITKEAWLNKATAVIDDDYCYLGEVVSSTQALSFPRKDIYDRNGYSLSSNEVPKQVKEAIYELAYEVKTNPTLVPAKNIKNKKIGPVSITYGTNDGVEGSVSGTKIVNKKLKSLLCSGQLNIFRT